MRVDNTRSEISQSYPRCSRAWGDRRAETHGERLAGVSRMPNPGFVLALLVAAGCGTTVSSTIVGGSPKPLAARSPASVEVFTDAPSRPYVAVSHLKAEQQSDLSLDGTDAFIKKLRRHAAELG